MTPQMKHYYANKSQYMDRNRKAKAAKRQWLADLKSVPCTDCGGEFPYYVMDFDHVPERGEKSFELSRLSVNKGWKALEEEVAKCDVVCANCHRIRTYERAPACGQDKWLRTT